MAEPTIRIRFAEPKDEAQIVALMPRLHAFPIHERRRSGDLWEGDARLAVQHLAGAAPHVFLYVADATPVAEQSTIAGLALVSMQEEFMSHEPGSHLEALLVADGYEGLGLGTRLLAAAEEEARSRGAGSMTLHVFNTNERAAALYRRREYEFEVQRCIKWF
ncbi:MAG: GNAT family N-acetyltransferase [Pseudomonadota bacterium]